MSKKMGCQAIFNKVWDTFVVRGMPQSRMQGYEEEPTCLYKHPTIPEHGCAIGCLFSDEEKKVLEEGSSITSLYSKESPSSKFLHSRFSKEVSSEFLGNLQSIHDNKFSTIKAALVAFAEDWKLKVPKDA